MLWSKSEGLSPSSGVLLREMEQRGLSFKEQLLNQVGCQSK